MTHLLKAPTVDLNTAALIEQLVGPYSLETQGMIHAIADCRADIMRDCHTMAEYKVAMQAFIDNSI